MHWNGTRTGRRGRGCCPTGTASWSGCRPSRAGAPALLDALHRYIDRLPEEPATEFFCISLDPDEQEVVWLHEWFNGEDGMTAHRAAPGFAELMAELNAVLSTAPGVMRFVPLRMHLADGLWQDEPL